MARDRFITKPLVRNISDEILFALDEFPLDFSIVHRVGFNPDIDTGSSPEDIWESGGVYTGFPLGAAETVQVFSSSASDTAAGVGARTVLITGLDSNYVEISEVISLAGVVPVNTTKTFLRIFEVKVLTSGTSLFNVGGLTCRHTVTIANVFSVMTIGRNITNMTNYTIAAGKTGFLRMLKVNVDAPPADCAARCAVWTRELGAAPILKYPFLATSGGPVVHPIYGGLVFPEKTDLILRAVSVTNNNAVLTGGFDLLLAKNYEECI